jgi:hypothetical protein
MAGRLNAEGKVARDGRIVADRARGLTWATIAGRHGLSERQCIAIWKERLAAHHLEGPDPREALLEAAEQLDAAIEDCALLAEATAHDAVRLGAVKARLAAMREKQDLLRLAGLLPCSPQAARTESDIRRITEELIRIFEKFDVPIEATEEVVEVLAVPAAAW